jgi:hypothetical protein
MFLNLRDHVCPQVCTTLSTENHVLWIQDAMSNNLDSCTPYHGVKAWSQGESAKDWPTPTADVFNLSRPVKQILVETTFLFAANEFSDLIKLP